MNSIYAFPFAYFAYFVVLLLKEDKTACYDHIVYFLPLFGQNYSVILILISADLVFLTFMWEVNMGSKYI